MKTNKALDPVAIGLLGFIGHVPTADQHAELIHEAGRVIRKFGWDILDHMLSLHAVYLYSILGLPLRYFTEKSGDIRQLSQNFVNFAPVGLQLYERYGIVGED
jgi:hypothetical protein